jgi:hypothetical protein
MTFISNVDSINYKIKKKSIIECPFFLRKDFKMTDIDNIKFNDTNKLDETSFYVIKLFILLYSIFFSFDMVEFNF